MRKRPACSFGAFAACLLAIVTATATARADLVYELTPTAGAGAADNVSASGQHFSDGFTLVGGTMRLRYSGARATHLLGYGLMYSKYLQNRYPDTLAHMFSWLSSFTPSALWTLRLGASSTLTRSSGLDAANPNTVQPESVVAGSALYLAALVTQGLELQPSARWSFGERLGVGHVRYLESMVGGASVTLPTTTYVALGLRGERLMGTEAFNVEVDATDSFTEYDGAVANTASTGHTVFGRALAGWRHELSPVWSTSLQAGPSVIYRVGGPGVAAPAAIAALNYARLPWFASIIAAQTPMANPYLGAAILADQVLVRLAVPLTRNERLFVGGFGGYSYARLANAEGHFDRVYDQFLGGLSLIYRFAKVPLAAAASYTVTTQRGSSLPGFAVADLARQYAFISLRGDLAWGRGTPPLFDGAQ
jgi:hypothetical protein